MSTAILDERPLTYEEERGKPMPSFNHSIIELRLGAQFLADRRFTTGIEMTLELLPGEPLTPDISVYPPQPLDLRHDIVRRTDPPLLTVEIVSPMQGMHEVMKKVEFYLAQGVRSVWVIAPPLRDVTIFLPDGSQQSHHGGVVTDPAIGIAADLDAVFS